MANDIPDNTQSSNKYLYIAGAVVFSCIGGFLIYSWVSNNTNVTKKEKK